MKWFNAKEEMFELEYGVSRLKAALLGAAIVALFLIVAYLEVPY